MVNSTVCPRRPGTPVRPARAIIQSVSPDGTAEKTYCCDAVGGVCRLVPVRVTPLMAIRPVAASMVTDEPEAATSVWWGA